MTYAAVSDFRTLYNTLGPGGQLLVAACADELGNHLDEIRRAINAQVLVELPALARASAELRDGLDRSTDANVALIRTMSGTWADPSRAAAPPEAVRWAKDLAHEGFTAEVLLKVYRIGHACLWQIWLRLLTTLSGDAALRSDVAAATSAYLFAYVEAVIDPIIAAHQTEREDLLRQSQSLVEDELRRVLRGESVDTATAGDRLRYRLDRWHIGFVVWTDDPDDADTPTRLNRAAGEIVDRLGYQGNALLSRTGRTVLNGWLGSWNAPTPFAPLTLAGVHIGVGEPLAGLDGFTRTHVQAEHARRVVGLRPTPPAFTCYRDVALGALLTADPAHAREFMTRTLGNVLDNDDADLLLETVAVYQAAGLSLQKAAETLHVHRNTIAYRVRKILDASGESDAGSLRLRAAVELARLMRPKRGAEPAR